MCVYDCAHDCVLDFALSILFVCLFSLSYKIVFFEQIVGAVGVRAPAAADAHRGERRAHDGTWWRER